MNTTRREFLSAAVTAPTLGPILLGMHTLYPWAHPDLVAKDELLRHPEVQAWLDSLWRTTKESILAVADDPDSDLRRRLDAGLVRAGRSLQEDPALRAKVDGWVERTGSGAKYSASTPLLITDTSSPGRSRRIDWRSPSATTLHTAKWRKYSIWKRRVTQ